MRVSPTSTFFPPPPGPSKNPSKLYLATEWGGYREFPIEGSSTFKGFSQGKKGSGKGFGAKGKSETVCRYFSKTGNCKYGKECTFKHEGHQQAHWTEGTTGKGAGAGWG